VIVSFGDPATEALYHGGRGGRSRRLPPDRLKAALRKLDVINAAHGLDDLRSPPGNRLEPLRGRLAGRHSIRINDQWRIVFRWTAQGAEEVSIHDYH
jgi:proteic killer suppression protein